MAMCTDEKFAKKRRKFGRKVCASIGKTWPVRQHADDENPVTQLLDEALEEASDEVRTELLREGKLDHFRLGATIAEMEAFLGDILWPCAYKRDDDTFHSDMLWASQQYGELFPEADEELCYDVIAWIRQVQQMPHVLGGGHSACEGFFFIVDTLSGKPRYENKEGAVLHFDSQKEAWVLLSPKQDVCFISDALPETTGSPKNGPPSNGWRHSHSTANLPVDTPQIFYDYVHFSAAELIIAKRQNELKQKQVAKRGKSTPILMGGSGVGLATDFLSHVQAEHFKKTRQAMQLVSEAEFPFAMVGLAVVGALMFVLCLIVQLDMNLRFTDSHDYYIITLFMISFFMLTPVAIFKVLTWNTGEVNNHRIWSDVMCLRQCQKDFDLGRVATTIKAIGNTTMFLDPLPGSTSPALMTRMFCIFEIFSAMPKELERDSIAHAKYEIELNGVVSPGGYFSTMPKDIERVSMAYAQSKNQNEQDAIMEMIANWVMERTAKWSPRNDVVITPEKLKRQGVAWVDEMLAKNLRVAFNKAEAHVLRHNVWVIFFIKTLVFVLSLFFELSEAGKLGWSFIHSLDNLTPRPVCRAVLEHNVVSYHEFFFTKFEHVQGPLVSVTAICLYCASTVHCLVEAKTPRHDVGVCRALRDMWQRSIKGIFTSGFFMVFMLFHEACICTLYLCMRKKQCIKFRPIVFVCHALMFLFPHCCVYRVIRILMVQMPASIIPSRTSVLHIGRLIIKKRDVLVFCSLHCLVMLFYYVFNADVIEGVGLFACIMLFCCFFVIESTHVRSPPKPPQDRGLSEFRDWQEENQRGCYGTFDHKTAP